MLMYDMSLEAGKHWPSKILVARSMDSREERIPQVVSILIGYHWLGKNLFSTSPQHDPGMQLRLSQYPCLDLGTVFLLPIRRRLPAVTAVDGVEKEPDRVSQQDNR